MNWEIFHLKLVFGIKISFKFIGLINTDISLEAPTLSIIVLLYSGLLDIK